METMSKNLQDRTEEFRTKTIELYQELHGDDPDRPMIMLVIATEHETAVSSWGCIACLLDVIEEVLVARQGTVEHIGENNHTKLPKEKVN